ILGRSMIVGKPLALLLMQKNKNADATVTVVHSRSRNLAEITRSADILIAAMGQANFVKVEHVRDGAVVVDVGINRLEDAASEFAQSRLATFASNYLDDCLRRQFAGAKSVIDSFPRKRLHHAGGIADKQQIFVCRRKRVSSKRCDRSPGMVRRNAKSFCCPRFERFHLARPCDKANI